MSIDVTNLDATAQAELVRTGDVAALELVEAAIARIETTLNAKLNAVVIPLFEGRVHQLPRSSLLGRFAACSSA